MGEDLLCSASELMCEEHFGSLIHALPKTVSQESASTLLDQLGAIKRRLVGKAKVYRFLRRKFLMFNFKSISVEMKIILPLLCGIILKTKIKRNPNRQFLNFAGKK